MKSLDKSHFSLDSNWNDNLDCEILNHPRQF